MSARGPFRSWQRRLVKAQLLERDGDRCWICDTPLALTAEVNHPRAASIDHIVPQAEGGTHELGNLRLAHRACNERRGVALLNLSIADRLRLRDTGTVARA